MAEKLYINSDNLIKLTELKNRLTDAFINDATVTVTAKDLTGTTVSGPITMDYVADSDGVYAGSIPDTASLDVGSRYDLVITANGGAGLQKEYTIRCEAVKADE